MITVVLVFGIPACGKSTFVRHLAQSSSTDPSDDGRRLFSTVFEFDDIFYPQLGPSSQGAVSLSASSTSPTSSTPTTFDPAIWHKAHQDLKEAVVKHISDLYSHSVEDKTGKDGEDKVIAVVDNFHLRGMRRQWMLLIRSLNQKILSASSSGGEGVGDGRMGPPFGFVTCELAVNDHSGMEACVRRDQRRGEERMVGASTIKKQFAAFESGPVAVSKRGGGKGEKAQYFPHFTIESSKLFANDGRSSLEAMAEEAQRLRVFLHSAAADDSRSLFQQMLLIARRSVVVVDTNDGGAHVDGHTSKRGSSSESAAEKSLLHQLDLSLRKKCGEIIQARMKEMVGRMTETKTSLPSQKEMVGMLAKQRKVIFEQTKSGLFQMRNRGISLLDEEDQHSQSLDHREQDAEEEGVNPLIATAIEAFERTC